MYFRKYRFPKTWLDKWLKSRALDDAETEHAENVSKHCFNLNGSTIIIFINHCECSAY